MAGADIHSDEHGQHAPDVATTTNGEHFDNDSDAGAGIATFAGNMGVERSSLVALEPMIRHPFAQRPALVATWGRPAWHPADKSVPNHMPKNDAAHAAVTNMKDADSSVAVAWWVSEAKAATPVQTSRVRTGAVAGVDEPGQGHGHGH